MEAALLGLLAFSGVVISSLIAALYRTRNSKGNPNSSQRVLDKLVGMEKRAERVEEKLDQAVLVLTEIRTILEARG